MKLNEISLTNVSADQTWYVSREQVHIGGGAPSQEVSGAVSTKSLQDALAAVINQMQALSDGDEEYEDIWNNTTVKDLLQSDNFGADMVENEGGKATYVYMDADENTVTMSQAKPTIGHHQTDSGNRYPDTRRASMRVVK